MNSQLPAARSQQYDPMLYDPAIEHSNLVGDDVFDIRAFWSVISKYRKTVFWFTFLVTATVATITFLTPPLYRATTVVEIRPEKDSQLVKFENINSTAHERRVDQISTQIDVLKSRAVAQLVIESLGLESNPIFNSMGNEGIVQKVKDTVKQMGSWRT